MHGYEKRAISFESRGVDVVGDLRIPDIESGQKRPAIVLAAPGSSVKEQIGAEYGRRFARLGYATLAFDPAYQGRSGGVPRDLEDPASRIEDIRCAFDCLATVDVVDVERVGLLGICAGGGYAVGAAMTDYRFKALGVVVPVNIGRARRQGSQSPDGVREILDEVGRQRTAEARGGAERRDPWIPDSPETARAAGVEDRDLLEAVEYYRTKRGFSEHSTNRRYYASLGPMMSYDAFHLVEELLIQPIKVVVAERLGTTLSFADGKSLFEKVRHKDGFHIVRDAGHYDMYDKEPFVSEAVRELDGFFRQRLMT